MLCEVKTCGMDFAETYLELMDLIGLEVSSCF